MADTCEELRNQGLTHAELKAALQGVVPDGDGPTGTPNGGFDFPMWLTLVDDGGTVCEVVTSLDDTTQSPLEDIWLGSRVISAQKASTANAFSMGLLSLSSANLFAAVQPGGSLYGLQHSNPVDTGDAYQGNPSNFGAPNDPLRSKRVGGVNVFGGGLALYNGIAVKVGAIGVSGDASCTDHVVAWKVRNTVAGGTFAVGNIPGGVASGGTDAMDQDIDTAGVSAGGFGHPTCPNNPTDANDGGAIDGN